MTVAQLAPSTIARSASRWLLLGSLALNLFFAGAAVAMIIRAPAPSTWDRNVFVRVQRLAATLPPADAALLDSEIQLHHDAIANTQAQYHSAREEIRAALRNQPFDVNAMRAAMARTRAARQSFDQVIQDVFADVAAKMSPAGRRALANWPPGRKTHNSAR